MTALPTIKRDSERKTGIAECERKPIHRRFCQLVTGVDNLPASAQLHGIARWDLRLRMKARE